MKKATLLMCCILFAALLSIPNLSRSQGIATPGGFGASGQTLYGGLIGNSNRPYEKQSTLAGTLGIGLGDAERFLGAQAEATLMEFNGDRSVRIGGAIHRVIMPGVSVAVGMNSLAALQTRGANKSDGMRSGYVVMSHALAANYPGQLLGKFSYSIGAGLGRFSKMPTADILDGKSNKATYVFGALQYAATKHINVHAEWSGINLNAAVSAHAKVLKVPFSVILGFMDLTSYSGNGARFMGGIGFSYNFQGLKSSQPENKRMLQILENQERQQLDVILKSAK